MSEEFYLGVDVGTGSVRAALVQSNGDIRKTSNYPIKTWNDQRDYYEQSSDNIWQACCEAIKAVSESVSPGSIKGIGFDATCSLVCIGPDDKPLTVSLTGKNEQNIILWMDHRAKNQADFINRHDSKVLKYVGGKVSLEMQTPKLLWIKENLGSTWKNAKYFFDLVDFLTWKATGDDSRSLCTVACKWTYIASTNSPGWDREYFSTVGLDSLLDNDAVKIGRTIKKPGETCGSGLTSAAAAELELLSGTSVGVGLIDAHAGGLGLLTAFSPGINTSPEATIGLICGTSTCHMIVRRNAKFVPGVWGPYLNAMVPNMYLNEAGQSATGKLIDFVIDTHPVSHELKKRLEGKILIQEYLNKFLEELRDSKRLETTARLTSRLHVWPDFHGNRSPYADPTILGQISGLTLAADEEDLAVKYLATVQALAYGTRQILATVEQHTHFKFSTILMCGGLSKNELFVQVNADVLGLPVLVPRVSEPVLLGSAILGAVAARGGEGVQNVISSMANRAKVFLPSEVDKEYHEKKYEVFEKLIQDQRTYDRLMDKFCEKK